MKDSAPGFTGRYVLALSLIAIFSILAYFNLSHLIKAQSQDGEVINVSGRQRMLSQKIALYSMRYDAINTQAIKDELSKNIQLMEKSHKWLTAIDKSEQIQNMYFAEPHLLDKQVKNYLIEAKKFLTGRDQQGLNYIISNSQKILKHLDRAVYIYQIENEQKISTLQRNELFIVIIVLVTLLFEALFIFRPANKSIIKKTEELITQKFNSDMVIESNDNAIIAINDKKEVYVYNSSAEKMFGYSKDEMLWKDSLSNIMRPEDYEMHDRGVSHYFETGKSKGLLYKTLELVGKRKDGGLFPLRINFGARSDDKYRIVVANMQDITSEREKENLLIKQSKLAAMGEMIGAIAHQWRQPLNALNINIENMEDDYIEGMIDRVYLDEFVTEQTNTIQFMSKTIDDFRNFFRIDREEEVFSVKQAIDSIYRIQSAQLKNNNILLKISGMDFVVKGYENEFKQVILNIVTNAKDAILNNSNRSGIIDIALQDSTITIRDNGGGIPEKTADRIFEPYFTTKEQGEGTGMGLYMCKMIIEDNMGGTLEVSRIEGGTEFILILKVHNG